MILRNNIKFSEFVSRVSSEDIKAIFHQKTTGDILAKFSCLNVLWHVSRFISKKCFPV